jgi:hypothetical protein
MEEVEKDSIALPFDKIVEIVRDLRNAIIKGFLLDENLDSYFKSQFNKELSTIKKQFLKKDLAESLIAPVDLVHYASLIKEIKESNSASIALKNEDLFYQEIDHIFAKYSF